MAWAEKVFAVPNKWRIGARSSPNPACASNTVKYRSWLIGIFLMAAALALAPAAARAQAGCDEDCKSEYVSALSQCRAQYNHGDRNLQDLEDCLVDTRGEYDDCIDDCTSMGAGGVVACKSWVATPAIFTIPSPRTSEDRDQPPTKVLACALDAPVL